MDCEPVVLNCRHTFCRGCLKDAHANKMKLCPICRQEIRSETVFFSHLYI
jgi:hypothetical protein